MTTDVDSVAPQPSTVRLHRSARGLPGLRLRVETNFCSTSLLHFLRGTPLLCAGGTEALDLLPVELDMGLRIVALR